MSYPEMASFEAFYLHYTKNYHRMSYLAQFANRHLPGHVIKDHDREVIAVEDHYNYNWRTNYMATCEFAGVLKANLLQLRGYGSSLFKPHVTAEEIAAFTPGRMSVNNLSLNLKHIHAWRLLNQTEAQWGLVMEDDIIFKDDSVASIHNLFRVIPEEIDYIDIAGGCGLYPTGPRFKSMPIPSLFYNLLPSTRTTCCYIINRRLSLRLIELNLPLIFPIDFQLNYAFSLLNPLVAWCSPELVIHGSEHGFYPTSNVR